MIEDAFRLGGYGSEILGFLWPGTVALLVALILVAVWRRPRLSVGSDWLPLLLMLFPAAILVWGAVAAHEDPSSLAPSWPLYVLVALLVLQLAGTAIIVKSCSQRRLFAIVVGACAGWWSLANAYVSGMAVTGDWL